MYYQHIRQHIISSLRIMKLRSSKTKLICLCHRIHSNSGRGTILTNLIGLPDQLLQWPMNFIEIWNPPRSAALLGIPTKVSVKIISQACWRHLIDPDLHAAKLLGPLHRPSYSWIVICNDYSKQCKVTVFTCIRGHDFLILHAHFPIRTRS